MSEYSVESTQSQMSNLIKGFPRVRTDGQQCYRSQAYNLTRIYIDIYISSSDLYLPFKSSKVRMYNIAWMLNNRSGKSRKHRIIPHLPLELFLWWQHK